MESVVLGVQIVLAATFATAGIGKLLDLPGSRAAVQGFGFKPRPAAVAGTLLPFAELAVAAALIPPSTARWAAVGALGLLVAFIGGISYALANGRKPDCNCFGQLHSGPAGARTLARNLGLAALATLVVVRGSGPALDDWIAARSAAELVALGVTLLACGLIALSLSLWSDIRELRRQLDHARSSLAALPEGVPAGAMAPDFSLNDVRGDQHSLASLLARGRHVLLVFVDPLCSSCNLLIPRLARWRAPLSDRLTFAVVSSGSTEKTRTTWDEDLIADVLLDDGSEVSRAYAVRSTPLAFAIDPDGRVTSAPAGGTHMIEVLARATLRRAADGDPPEKSAAPAPAPAPATAPPTVPAA